VAGPGRGGVDAVVCAVAGSDGVGGATAGGGESVGNSAGTARSESSSVAAPRAVWPVADGGAGLGELLAEGTALDDGMTPGAGASEAGGTGACVRVSVPGAAGDDGVGCANACEPATRSAWAMAAARRSA
jgi:hypothetical protein